MTTQTTTINLDISTIIPTTVTTPKLEEVKSTEESELLLENTTDLGCLDGICQGCAYSIDVPSYLPKLIGCAIGFVIAIIIFVLYLIEEKRKEKTFYFNNANYKENEEEKNERDGIAFGTNNVSYVVEQSMCGTPKNMGGGFKVLEKKPRARFAPAPPITPFSVNNNKTRESRVRTVKKEENAILQIQVTADRLGRGMELASLINETDVPVGYTSNEEKANYALETIRAHLEKMTEEKYVIYGYLDEKQWLFNGLENTLAEFGELRLEMKLLMTSPANLQITAFSVKSVTPIEKPAVAPREPPPPYAPTKEAVEKIVSENKKAKSTANTNLVKSVEENDSGVKKLSSKKQVREKLQSTDKSSKKRQTFKKATNTIQVPPTQTSQATVRQQQQQQATKNQNTTQNITPVPKSASPSPPNGPTKVETVVVQKKKNKDGVKSKEENTQQLLTAAATKILAIEKTTGSQSGSSKVKNPV